LFRHSVVLPSAVSSRARGTAIATVTEGAHQVALAIAMAVALGGNGDPRCALIAKAV
jgi:hypothetical protein